MAKSTRRILDDLGSGDGARHQAAKRGARAMGVEYNPRWAVEDRRCNERVRQSTFVQGPVTVDLSKASVITMFLLPTINMKLRPTLLALKPVTRVCLEHLRHGRVGAGRTEGTRAEGCTAWCTALLWIIPAKVQGRGRRRKAI
jgi:hypothetical protein